MHHLFIIYLFFRAPTVLNISSNGRFRIQTRIISMGMANGETAPSHRVPTSSFFPMVDGNGLTTQSMETRATWPPSATINFWNTGYFRHNYLTTNLILSVMPLYSECSSNTSIHFLSFQHRKTNRKSSMLRSEKLFVNWLIVIFCLAKARNLYFTLFCVFQCYLKLWNSENLWSNFKFQMQGRGCFSPFGLKIEYLNNNSAGG